MIAQIHCLKKAGTIVCLLLVVSFYLPFNLCSSLAEYKTGTTKRVIRATVIPPKAGIAIGIIISAPRPEDVRIGKRASNVVAVVIRQGRILFTPASKTANLTSWILSGL